MRAVTKRPQLTALDLQHIRHLAQECSHHEGLTMKLNWKTLQSRPGTVTDDFLMFVDNQLVGYLALYAFNRQEAEVSAMTRPADRRQGIFSQLLAEARHALAERNIPDFLFICEQKSESACHTMAAIGSAYEFSEYKMMLEQVPALKPNLRLAMRMAQPDDFPMMAELDKICFEVEPDSTLANLSREVQNYHQRNWIIMVDNTIAGKIQVTIGPEEIYLSGFGIFPEFRGRGYGRSVLTQVVKQLADERRQPIALEVAGTNRHALTLYQQCGFREVTAYDYYRQAV
ncbi:MAG: GNAT family N-acetyltransferase [Anaerolineae bacterium]|nr:GNAT family N-acetyltransferase [Anaerolineae bacterium]